MNRSAAASPKLASSRRIPRDIGLSGSVRMTTCPVRRRPDRGKGMRASKGSPSSRTSSSVVRIRVSIVSQQHRQRQGEEDSEGEPESGVAKRPGATCPVCWPAERRLLLQDGRQPRKPAAPACAQPVVDPIPEGREGSFVAARNGSGTKATLVRELSVDAGLDVAHRLSERGRLSGVRTVSERLSEPHRQTPGQRGRRSRHRDDQQIGVRLRLDLQVVE